MINSDLRFVLGAMANHMQLLNLTYSSVRIQVEGWGEVCKSRLGGVNFASIGSKKTQKYYKNFPLDSSKFGDEREEI